MIVISGAGADWDMIAVSGDNASQSSRRTSYGLYASESLTLNLTAGTQVEFSVFPSTNADRPALTAMTISIQEQASSSPGAQQIAGDTTKEFLFRQIFRLYHERRTLPELRSETFPLALTLTPSSGPSAITLSNNHHTPTDGWYENFLIEFFNAGVAVGEPLLVQSYDSETNEITVIYKGEPFFLWDSYRLREYRFFDGSQDYPYPGYAFVRFAVKYPGEIRADVEGFDITDPADVMRHLLSNSVWGAGDPADLIKENLLGGYKFEGAVSLAVSLQDLFREMGKFREFKLFARPDGIHLRWQEATAGMPKNLPGDLDRFINLPTLRHSSIADRTSKMIVEYRLDGSRDEMTQTIKENVGDRGAERKIELPFVYEKATADRVLYYQKQISLARQLQMSCSVPACLLVDFAGSVKIGERLQLPSDLAARLSIQEGWDVLSLEELCDVHTQLTLQKGEEGLYSYPSGRDTDDTADAFRPETDFSQTYPPPISNLEASSSECETTVGSNTITEYCIHLTWEPPDSENYLDTEIWYLASNGASRFVGRAERSIAFTASHEELTYTIFAYSRSPYNDLKGYPASAVVSFGTGGTTAEGPPLPPNMSATASQARQGSERFQVKLSWSSSYRPPSTVAGYEVDLVATRNGRTTYTGSIEGSADRLAYGGLGFGLIGGKNSPSDSVTVTVTFRLIGTNGGVTSIQLTDSL